MSFDRSAHDEAALLRLRQRAVEAMRSAWGDVAAIRGAITDYLRAGYSTEGTYFSPGALTDFFCVDTPSILDDAGYKGSDADEAVAVFDEINNVLVEEFFQQRKPT
jgi:hypothetical protein